LVAGAEEGAPVEMRVLKATKESTVCNVRVKGFWLSTRTYAGRSFSAITLPSTRLSGLGFPSRTGERGWYDFPAETRQVLLSPEPYTRALQHGVHKPFFPEKALGQNPRTAKEMEALGINPAGARPGIVALRGSVAVSRLNRETDIGLTVQSDQGTEVKLELPIAPAGFQGSDEGYTAPELVDEEFYASFSGEYRGSEQTLSSVERVRSSSQVRFSLPLFAVLKPGLVQISTNLVIELKHLAGVEDYECPFSWDEWNFKNPVINGIALLESLTAKGLKIEASRSAHYLILTPRAYRVELDEFALWKQSKGLTVDFAYVGTGGTDDVPPDRNAIDAYLEEYFHKNYCHGVYVLLIGDTDVIPTGRSNFVEAAPDGNDADSDHVYEVLGGDRMASLYVGRLSVNSAEELRNQLTKILSYERNPPPGSWPRRVVLAANSENDDGTRGVSASFPSKYAAAVNAIASYSYPLGAPTFKVLHAGAASASADRAVNEDVRDAIHEGCGQVMYRGHGDGNSWLAGWDGSSVNGSGWSRTTQIPLLTNQIFPIVYSIACQNARIRNNESLAEAWMSRVGGGACAHWGASVNSSTGENHERAKGVFRAIYESGFTRLGPALADAERYSMEVTGGGYEWDNNTFCYILLGDPEMTIRKGLVGSFAPNVGIEQLEIGALLSVGDEAGARLPGTFINVELAGGRMTNGFTGDKGDLLLPGIKASDILKLHVDAEGFAAAVIPIKPQAPRLVALGHDSIGRFQFRVFGDPGKYTVWGSADAIKWTEIGSTSVPFATADFTDILRRNSRFFYRVSTTP
jgi:hypothetical protein